MLRHSLFIVSVLTCLIVAFQNCAKAQFSSTGEPSLKVVSTGGPGTGDGGPVPPNQDPPPPTDPLPPVVPPTTNGGGDLIECQLGGPSSKVILDNGLSTGSNAQATRVCMSRSSCLQVVNQYAADRGCSLASGAATTEGSGAKCTGEFPGSKGTCKNARKLSDAEVLELLSVMSGS